MNDQIRLDFRNIKAVPSGPFLSGQKETAQEKDEKNCEVYHFHNSRELYEAFLSELSEFIIDTFEEKLLLYFAKQYKTEGTTYHGKELLSYLKNLEQTPMFSRENKKRAVFKGLSLYFAEKDSANVNGLVTFRLREYLKILERTAQKLVECYETETEYREFISLLKYFVTVQEDRLEVVHLIVDEMCAYKILDENKQDITEKSIREFVYPLDASCENYDDLLLSVLITLAPKKLIIHRPEKILNQDLFETITRVFSNISYCKYCDLCK